MVTAIIRRDTSPLTLVTNMNIERSYDFVGLSKAMEPYSYDWIGWDPEGIVLNNDNIVLTDKEGNFALFERNYDGSYDGHYLFGNARGNKAYKLAKGFIEFFFEEHPYVEKVWGLTPPDHKGALWLTKRLGFSFVCHEIQEGEPLLRFVLFNKDFNTDE